MSVKINDSSYDFIDCGDTNSDPQSIVEFAHKSGVNIPTLCFLKDCGNVGKCGLCSVMKNGKKVLACKEPIEDGDEIVTIDSESEDGVALKDALSKRIIMLLDKHNFACGKCSRMSNCEFLALVKRTRARAGTPYLPSEEEIQERGDFRSTSITIDRTKCVTCARCAASCALKTTTESITLGKLPENVGSGRGICPAVKEDGAEKTVATDLPFDETNCLLCGQCVLACPVAALQEKSEIEKVKEALADESKHVIVAIAPAVRTALGELFGMPLGTDVTGKIYTALRELNFDKVFDINFAADVTIMEEGTELLQRLGVVEGGHGEPKFPMYTSCCPGWVRLVDNYAPELYGNISSAKSPQQIFGAASKYYYPKVAGIDAKDVYTVTIMPCTAKKFEAQRDGMYGASGDTENRDVDAVLTTRELAEMIKKTKNADGKKIDFANLEDSVADPSMGEYTGAGTIFGVSGGVMEAALRTAADLTSGQSLENVDYEAVEGFDGVREATVPLTHKDGSVTNLEVAVVNGAANFFKLQKEGNPDKYHFIEVMVCPGGCINGGGQPHVNSHDKLDYATGKDSCPLSGHFAGTGDFLPEFVLKRASVLRKQDKEGNFTDKKRKSHENVEVQKMYETLGVQPSEGIAHKLFHVDYL